ncbi:MAG: glycosyltransferase, partial [Candidatus Nanopelagicales bacterium]
MSVQPTFSIIMPVYNPPLHFLELALQSVRQQLYPNWELCIADDASTDPEVALLLKRYAAARIKLIFRKENGHIATASNSALTLATGDYLVLFDQDDVLAVDALFQVAQEIERFPDVAVLYSDEDKLNTMGLRTDAYFKPDWNPDLFLSQNFISHLGVY